MKKFKKIPMRIEEKIVIDSILCDICSNVIRPEFNYDESEVKVEAILGPVYPESDDRIQYIIDVCPDCFTDKLIPLIEEEFKIKFRELGHSMDDNFE